MTQDPELPGLEQLLPPASETAGSWLQLIGDVAAIGAALGAVLLGGGAWFIRFWRTTIVPARDEMRRQNTLRNSLSCSDRTAKLLQEWAGTNEAMRALLLIAENCKFEQPAQPYRITVSINAARDGVPSVMDRWEQWPADKYYRELLARIYTAYEQDIPAVLLVTSEIPPEGSNVLRDYYAEQGVVASVVFFFKLTRRFEFLYVSLNFGEPRRKEIGEDGTARTLPHSEETVQNHLSRARELFDNPERIRAKIRRLQTIWANY